MKCEGEARPFEQGNAPSLISNVPELGLKIKISDKLAHGALQIHKLHHMCVFFFVSHSI